MGKKRPHKPTRPSSQSQTLALAGPAAGVAALVGALLCFRPPASGDVRQQAT